MIRKQQAVLVIVTWVHLLSRDDFREMLAAGHAGELVFLFSPPLAATCQLGSTWSDVSTISS